MQRLSIIAHGAGHSYTDAALNTNEAIIDVTGMRRILSWDPEHGIMHVEPGVTLRDLVRVALPDHWWLAVTPSTADATVGGCVAMNVNGKNAWKAGAFGDHVLSLTVLLASGQMLTLSPSNYPSTLFTGYRTLLKVPPQQTSQTCSGCGTLVPKELHIRWHACPECGTQLDRDENAARNILQKYQQSIRKKKQRSSGAGSVPQGPAPRGERRAPCRSPRL